jgi:type II secretory ATPase GspE/PulE/Tfp pilus assembly ATPase PilB-like protein
MTADMQELVAKKPTSQDIAKLASTNGSITMFEDGVQKVKGGHTTIEELLRVVPPEVTAKKRSD